MSQQLERSVSEVPALGLSKIALVWEVVDQEKFRAEIAENGKDVIYHFWPIDGERSLPAGFSLKLEQAFEYSLPLGSDCRAHKSSPEETFINNMLPSWDATNPYSRVIPRETYSVRVIGLAADPFASTAMRRRILTRLTELLA